MYIDPRTEKKKKKKKEDWNHFLSSAGSVARARRLQRLAARLGSCVQGPVPGVGKNTSEHEGLFMGPKDFIMTYPNLIHIFHL